MAAPAVPPPSGTDVAPTTEPHAASPIPDIAPVFEVEDVATAEAVVARLMEMPPHMIHACDTEVADIDITKSPIGQGRVTCLSIYSGPEVDLGRGPNTALWVDIPWHCDAHSANWQAVRELLACLLPHAQNALAKCLPNLFT